MKRYLTALQPSGLLHIGNYFGAIEQLVDLQDQGDNFLFVVDYHAITVPQDPKELRRNILFAAATYLAAGIDPKKTTLFQQSAVPHHTELAWILNCITHMGELERMTQFKDKSGLSYLENYDELDPPGAKNPTSARDVLARMKEKRGSVSVGLFDYPVLMAADILLYDTSVVPVGSDQKQHVELARDIAERFNNRFGETFVVPDVQMRAQGARIMGLDDPEKKMSKSAPSEKNYISLLDDEKTVLKKIKSAVTDSGSDITFEESRPGLANLLSIYTLVSKRPVEEIVAEYEGKGFGDLKIGLAAAVSAFLSPLQEKINGYLEHEDQLITILDEGAAHAREVAEQKMQHVRKQIGITLS